MIGLGVLAVAGIGLYMWKKSKDESSSSDETKSNAIGTRTIANKGVISTPQNTISGCEPTEHICGMHNIGNSNYIKCCKTSRDGASVFSHLGAMV